MTTRTKNYIIFVILAIIFFSWRSCDNAKYNRLQGERQQLEKQLKQEKDAVEVFRKKQKILFDSLSLADKLKDKKIADLNQSNKNLNQRLVDSAKELEKKKQSFKNKTFQELAEVFKEQGYKNATFTNTSVNLEKDEPVAVLEDLAEGQNCFESLTVKDSIISNKDQEIKIVNEKVLSRDLIIASKQIEIEKLDGFIKIQDDINKNISKENSKIKTKNFLTTYILPPLVFIGGVYIGKKL